MKLRWVFSGLLGLLSQLIHKQAINTSLKIDQNVMLLQKPFFERNPLRYFLIPFNFAFGENTSTGNLIRTERAEACREICKLGNGFFLFSRRVHIVLLTEFIKTDKVNGCGAFTWNSSTRFCELKQAQEGSWKYCEGFNH